ncbi:MAG: hypothetical protein IJ058_07465 [Lachnospiraceae bacterium]|nr:hypothetical protein [Lachnospiraceae bacterium]
MELQFSLIRNDLIFKDTFDELDEENGEIVFKHQNNGKGGIAVIYAPNGVGKSSFAKVLESNEASESIDFRAIDEKGKEYTPESSAFHVIEDQIQRNIIKSDESQYLVGKDIKREYELKKRVGEGFANTFKGSLPDTFKKKYKVTKIKDELLKRLQIVGGQSYRYILSIVNKSQRGSNIDRTEFVSFIENPSNRSSIDTLDEELHRVCATG